LVRFTCAEGQVCVNDTCSADPALNGPGGCVCGEGREGSDSGDIAVGGLAAVLALTLTRRRRRTAVR
jgi:MYXO-CTERM domain-containing protein